MSRARLTERGRWALIYIASFIFGIVACLAWLVIDPDPAHATDPYVCTASAPNVVYSAAQRASLGLVQWPDMQFGMWDSTMISTGAGTSGGQQEVGVDNAGTVVKFRTNIDRAPSGYDYVGAGPITVINGWPFQVIHLEHRYANGQFYATVGLGIFNPANDIASYIGTILSPQVSYATALAGDFTASMDTPNLILNGDGYAYTFIADTDAAGHQLGLVAARVSVSDLLASATALSAGHQNPPLLYKWNGSAYAAPGLGGAAADIEPGQAPNWQPNTAAVNGSLLIASTTSPTDVDIAYFSPSTGWTEQALWSEPGKFDAYPTIVPYGTGAAIFYLQWQSLAQDWSSAQEMVRTISCTGTP